MTLPQILAMGANVLTLIALGFILWRLREARLDREWSEKQRRAQCRTGSHVDRRFRP